MLRPPEGSHLQPPAIAPLAPLAGRGNTLRRRPRRSGAPAAAETVASGNGSPCLLDELHQRLDLLVPKVREGRHDRLEPFDNLRVRLEDRLTQVGIVSGDGKPYAVLQHPDPALIEPLERGADAAAPVKGMAGKAPLLLCQPGPFQFRGGGGTGTKKADDRRDLGIGQLAGK